MSQQRKSRRWLRRIALGLAAFLVVTTVAAVIVARIYFHGERLGTFVTGLINDKIRGRVQVASIEWPLWDITTIVTGGWMDLELKDVRVWSHSDELVLEAPRATGRIKLQRLAFDQDYYFDEIRVPGGRVVLREEFEPYPEAEEVKPPATYTEGLTVITLVAAFYAKEPPPAPGTPEYELYLRAKSPTWSLNSFAMEDVEVTLDFETFAASIQNASGSGQLYFAKPEGKLRSEAGIFNFTLRDLVAPTGELLITDEPILLRNLRVPRVAQRNPALPREQDRTRSVEWTFDSDTEDGARITGVRGHLNDYWLTPDGGTYDVLVEVRNAGKLAERLSGGVVRGDELELDLQVSEGRWYPKITATVRNAESVQQLSEGKPPITLAVDTATAEYTTEDLHAKLSETIVRVADGELRVTASHEGDTGAFAVDLDIARSLQLAPWLDRELIELTGGGRLLGRLHAHDIEDGARIDGIRLTLGNTRFSGAIDYKLGGKLETDGFRVEQDGAFVRARDGYVDLVERTVDLAVSYGSDNLGPLLRRFRQPVIARRAEGSARITGSFDAPEVPSATLDLRGVPYVGRVFSKLRYRGDVLTLQSAEASPFGGALSANGSLELGGREPRIVDLRVGGGGFDLSLIEGLGNTLAGTATVYVTATGPLSAPESTFGAGVEDLAIAGDRYTNFLLNGATDKDGSATLQFHVDRQAGGRLDINGTLGPLGDLGGVLSVREIPLHSLPGIVGKDGNSVFGGIADAEVQLAGRIDAPTADGYVSVTRGWFKNAFLGAADLSLEVLSPGKMRVAGSMFQGKFRLAGVLQTAPTPAANLEIGFRRIELDQFFPELAAKHDLRGWMSGDFRNLTLEPGKPPTFELHLTELIVLMENEDQRGRPRPIKVRAVNDMVIAYDGHTATLQGPAIFAGPTGEFTLSGSGSPDAVDAQLAGTIDIALLQPYFRHVFEDATGYVKASATISGPPDALRVVGVMDINDVALRPLGQDAEIRVPSAKLEITNEAVLFTGFSIDVYDEITEETDQLELAGAVQLEDFQPKRWGLQAYGKVAGKLLMVVAPNAFTAASGSADVDFAFSGTGYMPDIEGTISFTEETPLTFTPRGVRREILLSGGDIVFVDQEIEFAGISGTIDDSGQLVDFSGEMSLEDWKPASAHVNLTAEGLPFRVPQVLELELNVNNLEIVGDADGVTVDGALDIIDGRYIQKFNPLLDALRPERVRETETPFYEEVELIANAALDLRITTGGGFGIKNNIADIDLDGEILLTGTPARPMVDGAIQVKQGSFKFQGMRTRFERTTGSISFSRFNRFPDETPIIDLTSETEYLDTRGTEHEVVLRLDGTISNLNWDLETRNTGLNKAQTFTLLFSGRTTEENRALLGDTATTADGFDGNRSTADTESAVGAFDQLAKDFLGDFISVLVEDPLRSATGLDIVRIEVGTTGVGVRVEERVSNDSRAVAEYERTLNGQTWSVRAEKQLSDRLSIELEYLSKQFFEQSDEDEKGARLKAAWRDRVGE